MPFFMERKNEGKIKLTIFSHGGVAYRFGPHKQKCGMSAPDMFKTDADPPDIRYLKWRFLTDDTIFVPR